MHQSINQPPFWLSVRKEYVVDNFESLLDYLRNYQYIEENEAPDGDFNRTYKCLGEVADDYLAQMADDNLVQTSQDNADGSQGFPLKVLVAYLLTTKEKKSTDDFRLLGRFADLLLLWEWNRDVNLGKAHDIIFSSLLQRPVKSLGFTWNDLKESNDVFFSNFPYRLCKTTFEPAAASELPAYYEGGGLVVLQSDKLLLSPMRFTDYLLNRSNLYSLLPATSPVNIFQPEKIKQTTFTLLQESCDDIQRSFASISPAAKPQASPTGQLEDYQRGDQLVVRVTSISYVPIVESIDPAYNPVSGKVFLKSNYHGLTKDRIMTIIKKGDYLIVNKQNNATYPFELDKTFEDFFHDYCDDAVGGDYYAVFYDSSKNVRRWLTEEGLIVSILEDPTPEAAEAITSKGIITIHIDDYKQDRSNKWILTGSYTEGTDMQDDAHGDFKTNARESLLQAFVDYSTPEATPAELAVGTPFTSQDVRHLCHLVYLFTQHKVFPETADRYRNLFVAYQLAEIAQSPVDAAFIKHQLDYLACLVQFAEDRGGKLGLADDDNILGCKEVLQHQSILSVLNTYRNPILAPENTSQKHAKGSVENIEQLVLASNSLRGIIPPSELNRIKKTIAGNLGVADVYHNLFNDHTYYGEESDTLEFKTSIVYPPGAGSQPDPRRQRWNILKTICGFLNTVIGGELLLGVNDNGNSTGLKEDIQYLYKAKKINEMSADKYRLYVKYLVDNAFTDDTGLASLTEITTTRIKYIIEKNSDGDTILRIQVSPYEYGIVKFKDTTHLPEGFSDCYYRSSGSTIPMTDELCRQAREKKLSTNADDDTRRLLDLQRSMSERRIVILKDYSSKSSVKDRKVEVSQLLPERKAAICYDLDKNELREYKITRFKEVVFTNQTWKNAKEHRLLSVDLFGMMENPNQKPFRVVLKLKRLAYNLLLEENANAERHLHSNTDADAADYPFVLDTMINVVMGVGRFYMGLAQSIKIQEGQQLIDYARDCFKSSLDALQS